MTVIEQVAFWIALVAFLAMGGHRQLINAIVCTAIQTVPIGGGGLAPQVMLSTALGSLQAAFHASTRVAMPASSVAFFIATLTNGLMSRAMPQLHAMSLAVTLNLFVGFIMVMLGLSGWVLVSTDTPSRYVSGNKPHVGTLLISLIG